MSSQVAGFGLQPAPFPVRLPSPVTGERTPVPASAWRDGGQNRTEGPLDFKAFAPNDVKGRKLAVNLEVK